MAKSQGAQFRSGRWHCSVSKGLVAFLSFKVAGGIAQFQCGRWHCSVSKWLLPFLIFQMAGGIAQFPSGRLRCSVSTLGKYYIYVTKIDDIAQLFLFPKDKNSAHNFLPPHEPILKVKG